MTISKVRGWLYWFAKLLGDISAVKTGHVTRRIQNRIVGRFTSRIFRKR